MSDQNLFFNTKIIIKLVILFLITIWFGMDFIVVEQTSSTILYSYTLVMILSIVSLFMSLFQKLQKMAYILFPISFVIYLLMYNFVPEIVMRHKIDRCLDKGLVWDNNEQKCRNDCWHWSKETGCERK